MNQLCKELSISLDAQTQTKTRISALEKRDNQWQLLDENNYIFGPFDWVISTAPAEQTAQLFPNHFSERSRLENTKMQGCFSLMVGLHSPLNLPWQAAHVKNSDISWIAVNTMKPDRPTDFSVLAHSTNDWAEAHIEDDLVDVQSHLLDELGYIMEHDLTHADHIALHRWRYANIEKQSGDTFLMDQANQLAACGDWCIQGRVESAFLSATHLAQKLIPKIES